MAKATVTEVKGIKRLDIDAPADVEEVWVNGELIWAKWDSEEYKFIDSPARKPLPLGMGRKGGASSLLTKSVHVCYTVQ